MKQKIAVPTAENGTLDGHFGHCRYFNVYHVENDQIIDEQRLAPPPHEPGVLPVFLAEQGVTDVIAGGMGQRAIQIFNQHGVNVFVGAPQLPARELAEGLLTRSITFAANYCDH